MKAEYKAKPKKIINKIIDYINELKEPNPYITETRSIRYEAAINELNNLLIELTGKNYDQLKEERYANS